jgi:hypothetical protein
MSLAASIVDWGALGDVILISAVSGLAVALVLGLGIIASLRAETSRGTGALALNAVTVVSVLLVAGPLGTGLYFIIHKS